MDLTADIRVHTGETYPVEEKVFGHFIEHLGRCIRNGIWDERDTGAAYAFGRVRADVLDAMQGLRPPVLRWPGGCFSDTYHWRDGVGSRRPRRVNRAWWWLKPDETAFEDNHFGTHEFMELCRALDTEPYININFGPGSPDEAAAWVAYCNAPAGTPEGDERAAKGHPEPFDVKLWGIGNETWGAYEGGFCARGRTYARRYLAFLRAMKRADPDIRTVAVGANRMFPGWNRETLQTAGRSMDMLSLHEYAPGINPLSPIFHAGLPQTEAAYYSLLAGAEMFADSIHRMRRDIEAEFGPGAKLKIAFDEWNAWWANSQIIQTQDFTLRESLLTAATLSHLVKLSPIVGMANFAQIVNVIGLIITYPDAVVLTPSYHAFKLYRDHVHDDVLPCDTACETVRTRRMIQIPGYKAMPLVETLATRRAADGAISLLMVNRHFDEPITADISFDNFTPAPAVEMNLLYGHSPFHTNTPEEPGRVEVSPRQAQATDTGARIILPPHSVTQCTFLAK